MYNKTSIISCITKITTFKPLTEPFIKKTTKCGKEITRVTVATAVYLDRPLVELKIQLLVSVTWGKGGVRNRNHGFLSGYDRATKASRNHRKPKEIDKQIYICKLK